jgi:hypothetical protein
MCVPGACHDSAVCGYRLFFISLVVRMIFNIYILIGERIPAIPAPHARPVLCHHVSVCVLPIWIGHPACVAMFSCGCGSSGLSRCAPKKKEKNSSLQASPQLQLRSPSPLPREQWGRPRHWRPRRRFLIRLPLPCLLSPVLLPLLTLALRFVCLSCGTAFLAVHLGFHCRRPSFLLGFRLLWLYLRSGAPVP